MLRKFAAALIATSLIATPVFAAGTTGTNPAPVTQTTAKVGVHKVKTVRHGARHVRRGTHVAFKRTHAAKRLHVAAKPRLAQHGGKIAKHSRTSRTARISRG